MGAQGEGLMASGVPDIARPNEDYHVLLLVAPKQAAAFTGGDQGPQANQVRRRTRTKPSKDVSHVGILPMSAMGFFFGFLIKPL